MSFRVALGGAAQQAVDREVPGLVAERIASAVLALDPTLWGPDAEAGAAGRLGWTEAVTSSRPLVAEVRSLRARLHEEGVTRVVLVAERGATLAAEAVSSTAGADLRVLQPDDVPARIGGRLRDAVVVLASASGAGSAVEAALPAAAAAFRDAGIDPARRVVVVAPPGSPLDDAARRAGLSVVAADPTIGDRFAALSALTLVPAGLAGADIRELLDEAESEELNLAVDDRSNPGLVLGAAIAAAGRSRGLLAVVADGTHVVGLDDWAAHLVSASLGRDADGVLAVALPPDAPELAHPRPDRQVVRLVEDAREDHRRGRRVAGDILLSGTLGELLLVWQVAVAVAGHLLAVDPFADADAGRIAEAARVRLAAADDTTPPSGTTSR